MCYTQFVKGGESVHDHDALVKVGTVFQDGNCPG